MRAKFFNLPVPIDQDFLIILPYMTDRSIITDCQHGLNSWAPAIATGVLTTAPARYFMKVNLGTNIYPTGTRILGFYWVGTILCIFPSCWQISTEVFPTQVFNERFSVV